MLAMEWDDALKLASRTPRVALSPQVEKLQGTRRKVRALSTPSCASVIQERYASYMEVEIEGFLSFLADRSNIEYGNLGGLAAWLAADAQKVLSDFEKGAPIPNGPVHIHSVKYVLDSSSKKWVVADYTDMMGRIPQITIFVPYSQEFLAPPGFTLSLKAKDEKDGRASCEIWVDGVRVKRDEAGEAGGQAVCTGLVPND